MSNYRLTSSTVTGDELGHVKLPLDTVPLQKEECEEIRRMRGKKRYAVNGDDLFPARTIIRDEIQTFLGC